MYNNSYLNRLSLIKERDLPLLHPKADQAKELAAD